MMDLSPSPAHPALSDVVRLHRQGAYQAALDAVPLARQALAEAGLAESTVQAELDRLQGELHRDLTQFPQAEAALLDALRREQQLHGKSHPAYATALHALARLYEAMGQYATAESLAKQTLRIRQETFGLSHPDVANSLHLLAGIAQSRGNLTEAEQLAEQSMAIRQTTLPIQHADQGASRMLLARLYGERGQLELAALNASQALAHRQAACGDSHPETIASLAFVGAIAAYRGDVETGSELLRQAEESARKSQGDHSLLRADLLGRIAEQAVTRGQLADAETMGRESLRIRLDLLGPKHVAVAHTQLMLAWVLRHRERFEESESLIRDAYQLQREWLGESHPDLAETLADLGSLLLQQERLDECEPVLQRALLGLRAAYGVSHPRIASVLVDLSWCRCLMEQPDLGVSAAREAVTIYEETLGGSHPETGRALDNLATVLRQAERLEEAEALFPRLTELVRVVWGDEHDITLETQERHAELLLALDRVEAAEALFRSVHDKLHASAGPDDPRSVDSVLALAEFYHRVGRYRDAEPLYRDALIRLRTPDQEPTIEYTSALHNLARLYHSMGDLSAAEVRFREVLGLRERLDGTDSEPFASALGDLAQVYLDARQYAASEALFEHALELRRQLHGDRHPETARMQHGLGQVLVRLGRYHAAEPLLRVAAGTLADSLGTAHAETLRVTHSRGVLSLALGKPMEAERLLRRLIEQLRQQVGPENPWVAEAIFDRAKVHATLGDAISTEPMLREARRIHQRAFPADHPIHTSDRYQLAQFYLQIGEPEQAFPLADAIETDVRQRHGDEHPEMGEVRAFRGTLFQAIGDHRSALRELEAALQSHRAAAGNYAPAMMDVLTSLSMSKFLIGDDDGAETAQRQAVEIARRHPNDPASRSVWDSMAALLQMMGRPLEAEPFLRELLEHTERTVSPNNPVLAVLNLRIAEVLRESGQLRATFTPIRMALEILDGSDEAQPLLDALARLAALHTELGELGHAERLLRQWRSLERGPRGCEAPGRAEVTSLLAMICASTGREAEAMTLLDEVNLLLDRQVPLLVALPSARERLLTVRNLSDATRRTLTIVLRDFDRSDAAHRLACELVLRRKLSEMELLVGDRLAYLPNIGIEGTARTKLRRLRRQIARRTISGPGSEGGATHRRLLDGWWDDAERLTARIAVQRLDLAVSPLNLPSLSELAAAMPANCVGIEWLRWRPVTLPTLGAAAPEHVGDRYLAVIVPANRPQDVAMVDFGDANELDCVIDRWIAEPNAESLAELRQRVIEPLLPSVVGATRWIWSPADRMTRLPIERLLTQLSLESEVATNSIAVQWTACLRDFLRPRRDTRNATVAEGLECLRTPASGGSPMVWLLPDATLVSGRESTWWSLTPPLEARATLSETESARERPMPLDRLRLTDTLSGEQMNLLQFARTDLAGMELLALGHLPATEVSVLQLVRIASIAGVRMVMVPIRPVDATMRAWMFERLRTAALSGGDWKAFPQRIEDEYAAEHPNAVEPWPWRFYRNA
ncbi:tetratricopeptide repeat protein [Tuwongella immobilis]|uniref:CHAT domain-containing protein n=1 Tax=Tuwongella immobilis TaxID=692036 RepID=A0A6C2YL95_9BACT|nr:tetratricopeptide repeat protein [Tuwongella immobilis]VIP01875.1 tfp pilus assembly protein : Tfp pilus assembly protein PilF OS=Chloracidobacterium thermophilum (strain B) GN=Cabther_B0138 PE=4 SV=1: TPR_12: TPR_12: TPR_10: TPR_12: TPR_12: TPR_12: TPR_12: TPR_10: TPR_10 [Tuwongella immobilis]VTR99713.1 tfp pilus assembly protein : Tfp pilus assembly protein PilF OS=Chloracidobacterium thermophilum (strain B) GN=Cabther_B0138 PE=4 SV=1: TPR_12: TPR_12: TPR_10: TPR_12: TPR_12: TPR_12: TPR_12: 